MTHPPTWLTWAQFKTAVRALLPIDSKRIGIQDSGGNEGFLTKTIRQGVIEVQNFIPRYRIGHETIYEPDDFVTEGHASRAVLPQQSKIRDAWFWVEEGTLRYPMLQFPWERRFEMVNNMMDLIDNQARICQDPLDYTFYVFPEVEAGKQVSIFWDGIKIDFADGDATPFDEQLAGVVADYCRSRIARDVEKDIAAYRSYAESYKIARRNLFLRPE